MPFLLNFKTLPVAFCTLLIALGTLACKTGVKKDQPDTSITNKSKTEMPTPARPAPPGDYADDWKIVDSLEQQGLFKSALEKVETIYTRAKSTNTNSPQVIKSLIFKGKYMAMLEEDGMPKAAELFETELAAARPPQRAILQSLLAQLYATYLQNQGWRIRNRTDLAKPGDGSGSLLTWSAEQIERRSLELYAASIENPAAILQEALTEYYKDILTEGQNDSIGGKPIRPYLYDVLTHRALAYFANERSYLTQPAYAFVLDQEAAFAPAKDFLKAQFETQDSTSGKWLAIKTFQKVMNRLPHMQSSSHGNQSDKTWIDTAALIDADLLRLQFVYNNSVLEDKASRYRNVLEGLHKQYYNHPMDAEIIHQLAQFLYSLDAGDKAANAKYAVAELESAISRHPNTYGARQSQVLLNQIRAVSVNVNTEQVYLPEKTILIFLSFRNLKTAHVRVMRGTSAPDFFENVEWDKRIARLLSQPTVQTRQWSIQNPGDYQEHRTELSVEALPPGHYWVLVSENAEFNPAGNVVAYTAFAVSNLAAVQYHEVGTTKFVLAHRSTGLPLAGVRLDFFQQNYRSGRQERRIAATSTTDVNGMATANLPKDAYTEVRAVLAGDTLWVGNASNYRYQEPVRNVLQVQFFTDRSLYRPGQTVYFKGVLFQSQYGGRKGSSIPQIVPNQSVTVKFYDANGQEKNSLKLRSNEFGTFNGAFLAPASGLTGQMSIRCDDVEGSADFNVEEYKRPRFEVTVKPVEGAFRLGEKIAVRGEAKNYAGNVVDGATLRYRVVRQARFPLWDWGWGWSRRIMPPWNTDQMEITNGKAVTDANGAFSIEFEAIPDRSIPKKDQPVFDFQVMVDVTDITGETRSSTYSVSAGYAALQVDFGLSNDLELDSLRRVALSASNMAGQPQNASGIITIQRLIEPKTFYINRLWERPDVMTLPKAEFERMFPDYAWKDEDDPAKWEREGVARMITFNTASAKTVDLNDGKLQPGYYAVKLTTKDAFGEPVEVQRVVRVWDKNNRATQFVQPTAVLEKSTLEPGQTARIWMGGKPTPLHFFFARERNGELENPRWLAAANSSTSVEIPIVEDDRGGLSVHCFVIRNNRHYPFGALYVSVPWSNKDLNISYETFRDKLAPGQKEEWRIKISGPKKEKVAAEMVAAMYDASLDQFLPHAWSKLGFPYHGTQVNLGTTTFGTSASEIIFIGNPESNYPNRVYPEIDWFNFPLWGGRNGGRMYKTMALRAPETEGVMMDSSVPPPAPLPGGQGEMKEEAVGFASAQSAVANAVAPPAIDGNNQPKPAAPPASIRRNLNETVFFYPELRTDAQGNLVLKFTMNEALTRWKLLTFAHTKDLQQVLSVKEVVTQKELMVIANPPRFFRAGDEFEFSAKVSNLSQQALNGTATLNLLDANTLQPISPQFGLSDAKAQTVNFSAQPGQSAPLAWRVKVPADFAGAVTWQIAADSKQFRDGEESTVPVVTNRMLVTETLPITVRGNQNKSFVFENFKNAPSGNNASLVTHNYTLEFTSNPAWYAVQSLPYLMEFPHECSEQMFSRFYANALAASVVTKMPQIKRMYDRWKGTDAMKSNLAKNQDLKYALLEETPWVLEAQNEAQQKQNIALLFDLNRMADEQERVVQILSERQSGAGGWAWFPGGQDSWYITQHIVSGFGHLTKLGAFDAQQDQRSSEMLQKALGYCETKMNEQYRELEKQVQQGKAKFEDDHLDGLIIQYLYARSFFIQPVDKPSRPLAYYLDQTEKYWLGKGLYQEGMLALALHRNGREAAQRIVASLRERATMKDELGMYWPVDWGFYWYQLPVETQALMVEVFGEVVNDQKAVEELRIWLLKNKQTNRWESTKATAEAVYALLLFGDNWLNNSKPVQVSLGGKALRPNEVEAGTGYFKEQWRGADVKPSWSKIEVQNPNSNIVWGAAYWQYFEDLDKIKDFRKTPLTIVKQLFTEENTPTGPVLKPVNEGATLKRGDKIKVRIEIRVDRAMEYVHLKDMRAAGFEPVNVLSGYRYQDGLGYYESTKDLATHFFIDYLPRGTFVFEYPLVVNHRGDMSNGVTTLQCMYAPEFTSHSKGVRVKVE